MTRRRDFMLDRPGGWMVGAPLGYATSMMRRASSVEPVRNLVAVDDALGEALHSLRMSSVFYTRSEFTAPWALELPAMPGCLMFHVVTSGRCALQVPGVPDRALHPGVFALVPHGDGHHLTSGHGVTPVKLFDLPLEHVSERYDILVHGGGGERTAMVCGAVLFDHPAAEHLVRVLPQVICSEGRGSPEADWIQSTLRLMSVEAGELLPGGESVITRLADVLVIQAIRSWIASDPAARSGWLGALRDRQIGGALLLIHRDPARAWTVDALASGVSMSRSAFAARFKELVGESPMSYLANWRMQVAATWLREGDATIGAIASRLSYESEAAFSRAFKRTVGVSPGSLRRPSTLSG